MTIPSGSGDRLEFSFLADRIDAIPLVTQWYVDEWGYREPGNLLENEYERLRHYANRDRIPRPGPGPHP